MQIAHLMTSHHINQFWKFRLQQQETLLNEVHGNVAYNIS